MPRGYPDFFGFSTFPYFGPVELQHRMNSPVAGGGRELEFELLTKSIIRAGYLHITGQDAPITGILDLSIDDLPGWFTISLAALRESFIYHKEWFFYLTEYSPVDELYTIAFRGDTTIGQTFRLYYENGGAGAATLDGYLWYTEII